MQKDFYHLRRRNTAIKSQFIAYIQSGLPRMTAYAKTGEDFYLSEKRVRDIVAGRAWPFLFTLFWNNQVPDTQNEQLIREN